VFTARYTLRPYIKQVRFVLIGLIIAVLLLSACSLCDICKNILYVVYSARISTFDVLLTRYSTFNSLYEVCVLHVTFFLPDQFDTICKYILYYASFCKFSMTCFTRYRVFMRHFVTSSMRSISRNAIHANSL
jgi:hypothetical protein